MSSPTRSVFIEWPNRAEALEALVALEQKHPVPFDVHGITVFDKGEASVYFTIAADAGTPEEDAFIAAGLALGGEYTGS